MHWQKIIFLLLVFFLLSCARVVMPPGGPIDRTPPTPKKCTPENFNTQFSNNKITIEFDEFVVLKDFNQEFISSPLLGGKPKKTLSGKTLTLKINADSLIPNTSYTLNFGNSIVDYRAGNILKQYEYVFSTGDFIDSLHISGHLYMAQDLSPQENVWILLYKNYNDTSLVSQKPDFIAKTDSKGYFSINNIAAGEYGIAALKDINNNYIFDLPNEQIAFLDTTFVLSIKEKKDTVKLLDSLDLSKKAYIETLPDSVDLFLFEENYSKQYLTDYIRENKFLISLIFNESYDTNLSITFNNASPNQWLLEPSTHKDTFNIWLTDTNLANKDSLKLFLDFYKTDSLQQLVFTHDTLFFTKKPKSIAKSQKNKLEISSNFMEQRNFDFFRKPFLTASFPLVSVDLSKIKFYQKIDSSFVLIEPLVIKKDSLNQRRYNIEHSLIENTEYKIEILPKAFIDYRNWNNDTMISQFKTSSLKSYTEILLKLKNVEEQTLIQLLNTSGNIVAESIVTKDTNLTFNHLKPINYKLKQITDSNHNGKWDTGNYLKKQQAETIRFYKKEIPTKANWSHDIIWDLKK